MTCCRHYDILAKTRSILTTAIAFSRQNDAGSLVSNTQYWESVVHVVFLVSESKALWYFLVSNAFSWNNLGSLSNDFFERRTSTGGRFFAISWFWPGKSSVWEGTVFTSLFGSAVDFSSFQVCLVMIVINMAVRCDISSVVYAIWLGVFLVLGRQNSSIVWPVYVGFLAVLLPLQYLLVLGWPPALCLGKSSFGFDFKLMYWQCLFVTSLKSRVTVL